ncbi:MAG: hypothetical protein BIP78_0445 [Candidatus Bipolaricaulis sibiricus]|uniref:Chromosome partition protein Smc n=1 Tax=Bipolaricaulis sibiricus TaxID=2501609 RepID=A0A410FTC1_BIPS1|nr:MAG: hypothetical protein BIP78_0445 [Candidatus Bipolaricaulis sibiricus]
MMKRVIGGLVAGAVLLGGMALAQGAVQLPPAEEEIAAMESAFSQVSLFFAGLITELKGAVATLNAVDADLAAKYRVVAAQLRDAEAKIKELQEICARIPGLMAQVDGLAARLDEAWVQITTLRGITESLTKTDQELAAGIASLAQNLEKTRQEFATAIATLGDKVSDLTKQGTVHANRLTAVEGAVLALKSQIEACEASLRAEIEARDERLSQEIVSLQGSIAGINRQLSEHAGRIAALEAQDIGSMQRRILALEQAVQALNIKIENNREKIAYLEKAIGGFTSDLKTTVGALQAQVDDHETRLTTVEATVTGLDVKALQDGLAMAQGLAIVALLAGLAGLVLGLLGG